MVWVQLDSALLAMVPMASSGWMLHKFTRMLPGPNQIAAAGLLFVPAAMITISFDYHLNPPVPPCIYGF